MTLRWAPMVRSERDISTKQTLQGLLEKAVPSFSHKSSRCVAMPRSSKIFRYVSKRLLQGIPIIIAIIVINFFLLNLAEGDAVDVLAGEAGSATPEYMEQLRKKFG